MSLWDLNGTFGVNPRVSHVSTVTSMEDIGGRGHMEYVVQNHRELGQMNLYVLGGHFWNIRP